MSQQAPDIDGVTYINDGTAKVGDFVKVRITDSLDYDLVGEIVSDETRPTKVGISKTPGISHGNHTSIY
jgi:hypothetical protein